MGDEKDKEIRQLRQRLCATLEELGHEKTRNNELTHMLDSLRQEVTHCRSVQPIRILVPRYILTQDSNVATAHKHFEFEIEVVVPGSPTFVVQRRFSAFVELHKALAEIKPLEGYLPNLPKTKGVFGSTNVAADVDARRRHLQIYLNQLAAIPEVRVSADFVRFLEADKRSVPTSEDAIIMEG